MPKKIPLRQCLGCREMKPKRELIRVVRSPRARLAWTSTQKAWARGSLLPRPGMSEADPQVESPERAFDLPIPDAVYDALAQEMEGGGLDG